MELSDSVLHLKVVPVKSRVISLDELIDRYVGRRKVSYQGIKYRFSELLEEADSEIKSVVSRTPLLQEFIQTGHFLVPRSNEELENSEVFAYPVHDRLVFLPQQLSFPSKGTNFLFIEGAGYSLNVSKGLDYTSGKQNSHWRFGLCSRSVEKGYLLNLALYSLAIKASKIPPVAVPLGVLKLDETITIKGRTSEKNENNFYQFIFASQDALRFGDALYSIPGSVHLPHDFHMEHQNTDLSTEVSKTIATFFELGQALKLNYSKDNRVCFDLHNISPHEIHGLTRYPTPFISDGSEVNDKTPPVLVSEFIGDVLEKLNYYDYPLTSVLEQVLINQG